ncbi:hypothetical protein [Bradyrhizobium archetypum]|uniref:Uncharacterized protein n=1 Tax=Bradyrhizobium archetypum TaxID=2721160 RepID=A0A7Y4M417_9BRAD|nr:hypothetical protein [Bradyrhizobium archetypum]NOJ49378.1 hypothetical protein [Bradyrhizobium archetypum]
MLLAQKENAHEHTGAPEHPGLPCARGKYTPVELRGNLNLLIGRRFSPYHATRIFGIPTHHWDKTGDTELARNVRCSSLEMRTARLKLAVRRKPYSGPALARGVALLYRRNKTNGTWVLEPPRQVLDESDR